LAGFLGAEHENRAFRFLDNFLGNGTKRNPSPTGHPVGGDNDHVDVVLFSNPNKLHSDLIGGANLGANFEVLIREFSREIRKTLLSCVVQALSYSPSSKIETPSGRSGIAGTTCTRSNSAARREARSEATSSALREKSLKSIGARINFGLIVSGLVMTAASFVWKR
jgi:hypothetical protein